MKVGKLNAAIDAAAEVYGVTRLGLVAFKKGSLKEGIRETFGGDRAAETGLALDERGAIVADQGYWSNTH